MPTTVTKTLKSAGGDYTSLSAWEAGEQGDLVLADEIRQAECYSFADTTAVTIDGSTTDATRYLRVFTPAAERHDGKWNTGKHRVSFQSEFGATNTLLLADLYTRIEGLQIENSIGQSTASGIAVDAIGVFISHCIIRKEPTWSLGGNGIFVRQNSSGTTKIWNTIIYDAPTFGIMVNRWTGAITRAHNITIQNSTIGFDSVASAAGVFVAKNCIAQDNATDGFAGTFDAASTDNCSDIASDAPGSNPETGEVTFVDEANDNFLLDSSDTVAKDKGADLSADANLAFSDDIIGTARPQGSAWDIGASEVVAAGGGGLLTHPGMSSMRPEMSGGMRG